MSGQPYIHDAKPTLQLLRGGAATGGRQDACATASEALTIKEFIDDTLEKCKARVLQWMAEDPRKGLTYTQMDFLDAMRRLAMQYGDIERGQTVTPHLARRVLAMLAEMDRPCEKRVHRAGAKNAKKCNHEGAKATKTEREFHRRDAKDAKSENDLTTGTEEILTTENADAEQKEHHENTKARNGADVEPQMDANIRDFEAAEGLTQSRQDAKEYNHEGTKATKTEREFHRRDAKDAKSENNLTTGSTGATGTEKNFTTEKTERNDTDAEQKEHHENTKPQNGPEPCSEPSASFNPHSELQVSSSCPPCPPWLNSPAPLRPLRLCGEPSFVPVAPERPAVQSRHRKMDTGLCRYDGPRSKPPPGRWRGWPVREVARRMCA